MNTIERADNITRFKGRTAADMNYRARIGSVDKGELEDWAKVQNKYMVSIEWYVAEYATYQGGLQLMVPELRDRRI